MSKSIPESSMPNGTRTPTGNMSAEKKAPVRGNVNRPGRDDASAMLGPFGFVQEYWLDAMQRTVLCLDALRLRGDTHLDRAEKLAPHVLSFDREVLVDGRTLPRPVNYALVRIVATAGVKTDPYKRPFIVFDPRAGHGPGIGGMKQDSEIGVALAAGHPCYFVGFMTDPVPGQTIEDVCRAEAHFLERVIALHPQAESKPCLIGNCQAGWQILMMCAMRPDLPGPILLAGTPLSYWAGVRGKNPMRYSGGMLGGSWLTALTADLGNGLFDGAHLVANFENMNLANTYWGKAYNLYSKVDTEAARFLDFETWWGSPVTLNAKEMQFIVDELFVGNKLAAGGISTSDGVRVDLRNIRSPVIVFCSWGDDITPPQQALGWLLDLYDTDAELVAAGQTVVYTVHQSIGHLGIFVSGKVATREHAEFTSCMDMIDLLPPGLYEAVITEVDEDIENPELVQGKYLFRLEARRLDHIRALGVNSAADQRRFETAAKVSEVNHGLYEQFAAPAVRAMTTDTSAEMLRRLHPHRVRFELLSSRNPALGAIPAMADTVRENRRPCSADNPLLAMEGMLSSAMTGWLDAVGKARDTMVENIFLTTYGSPFLQALVGLGGSEAHAGAREARDLAREAAAHRAVAELERRMEHGDLVEAGVRALIHILRAEGQLDERAAAMLEALRNALPAESRLARERFREIIRDQSLTLRLDEDRAVETIPELLPDDPEACARMLGAIRRVAAAQGKLSEEGARRLARVVTLFEQQPANDASATVRPPRAPPRRTA
jgi:pimeloyl-ACP methyl ester carboxylesterase